MSGFIKTTVIVFYLWAGLLLSAGPSKAEPASPFDSLHAALRYVNNFNRNIHHDYWKPGPGFEAGLATDFYLGIMELGGTWAKYAARQSPLPDYGSLFLFVGWGLDQKIMTKIDGIISLRVGNHMMIFDDDYVAPEGRIESELAVELVGAISLNITHQTALEISGRYRRVYTFHRLKLAYVGIGLSHSMASPGWLKRILR